MSGYVPRCAMVVFIWCAGASFQINLLKGRRYNVR